MNETAAAGVGVDAARLKTAAFTLSAAIAGAAGGIYASWIGYIDPTDVYDVMWSVRPIVATLIGGIGTILGPVIGTLVYVLLEEVLWRNLLSFGTGALGIFVIVLLLVMPTGIMPSLLRSRRPV
jgi:branched-chain amino acid transport system permease protein